MASLLDIRQQLKEDSDYSPSNGPYDNYLDRMANQAMREIWEMEMWNFAVREVFLDTHSDVTGSGQTATLTNMSRNVIFSSAVGDFGSGFIDQQDDWQGQYLELLGRDYQISKIINSASIYVTEPVRLETATATTGSRSWKLKYRDLRLPEDCVELLTFSSQDRPIPGSQPSQAGSLPIVANNDPRYRADQTSDRAALVFKSPDLRIPPGQNLSSSLNSVNSLQVSAFPNGWYGEFAWAYQYANQYGTLSSASIIGPTAGVGTTRSTITISFLDKQGQLAFTPSNTALDSTFPVRNEGLKKRVFFNVNLDPTTGERLGLPCWLAVLDNHTTGSQTDHLPLTALDTDSSVTITTLRSCDPSNPRYVEHVTQQVRPYPRISTFDKQYPQYQINADHVANKERFKQVVVQYLSRPPELLLDEDVPALPSEFHQLIVYKALENIFVKKNELTKAAFYADKFQREIKSLKNRYLNPSLAGLARRSRWTSGSPWENYLFPPGGTITTRGVGGS